MPPEDENESAADGIEIDEYWQRRELCSDGNCIGVIGADGRCNECGRPHTLSDIPAPSVPPENSPESEPADRPVVGTERCDDFDQYWSNRRLCPDGNCIGVIGPDGKCRECGRDADS